MTCNSQIQWGKLQIDEEEREIASNIIDIMFENGRCYFQTRNMQIRSMRLKQSTKVIQGFINLPKEKRKAEK